MIATGDFNGDGKGDILWRDGSGNVAVWLMSCSLSACSVLQAATVGNVPSIWTALATGDFNGDGKSDILWRDSSGNVAIWFHEQPADRICPVGRRRPSLSYSVAGIGSFKGSEADILWRDTGGNLVIWLMKGATVVSVGSFNGPSFLRIFGGRHRRL